MTISSNPKKATLEAPLAARDAGRMEDLLDLFARTPDEAVTKQIVDRICELVAIGRLRTGDRVPSLKQLAEHYGVNGYTINLAYRQLKKLGVTTSEDRSGSYIQVQPAATQAVGGIMISHVVHSCRQLGLSESGIKSLFDEQLKRHFAVEKRRQRQPTKRRKTIPKG